jgi:hypothetical protein
MAKIRLAVVVSSILLLSGCPREGTPDAALQQHVEDLSQQIDNLESVLFLGGGGRSTIEIEGSVEEPCGRTVRTERFPRTWVCYPGDRDCPVEVVFAVRPRNKGLWMAGDTLNLAAKSEGDFFGCAPGPVTINSPSLSGRSAPAQCDYVPGLLKYWEYDVVLSNDDLCGGEVDREDPVVIMRSRKG